MTEPNPDLDGDGDVDDTDIATALSNYTVPVAGGKTPAQGDTDGDGDVDDADLANIFAAYTGPIAPPETIDAEEINLELARKDRVEIPGGATIIGGLVCPGQYTELVCVSGKRPTIEPARNQNAITFTSRHIERAHVSGIAARSDHRDGAIGIAVRLHNHKDQYAKWVEFIDNKFANFDTGIEVVDDFPRKKEYETGQPGRINLIAGLNIIGPSYGDDSHSVGMYLEGLASGMFDQNAFDKSGWLVPSDKNKRSHSIYAQSFGSPIVVRGNVMSRAAANAAQLRSGGTFETNICTECALGPFIGGRNSDVRDNVVIDQVDIQEHEGYDPDDRGHGLVFGGYNHAVTYNMMARRHGSLGSIPAIKGLSVSDSNMPQHNVAIDWADAGENFEINGKRFAEIGSNQTIMHDPGVPRFIDIEKYMTRERGEAFTPTTDFIKRCWGAVQ